MYEIFDSAEANEEIFNYYCAHDIIEIQDLLGGSEEPIAIFFTGHGLYYPTNIERFRYEVLTKNKYEWKNISNNRRVSRKYSKAIFVRDVYKNWCIMGGGRDIRSQDQLASKLKELINGKRCVTIGSSAGGYMAVLFGILLGAEAIFAFSPQINLHEYHIDHPIKYYDNYVLNSDISKYMDLTKLIKNYSGHIFYFFPYYCAEDYRQFLAAKKCENIFFYAINQSKHGSTIWGDSIIFALSHPYFELAELSKRFHGKIIEPWQFSLRTAGLFKTMVIFLGKTVKGFLGKK